MSSTSTWQLTCWWAAAAQMNRPDASLYNCQVSFKTSVQDGPSVSELKFQCHKFDTIRLDVELFDGSMDGLWHEICHLANTVHLSLIWRGKRKRKMACRRHSIGRHKRDARQVLLSLFESVSYFSTPVSLFSLSFLEKEIAQIGGENERARDPGLTKTTFLFGF